MTFIILAVASPKDVKDETPTNKAKAPPIRRQSSVYEAFTKGVKVTMNLHARIYIGLLLEGKLKLGSRLCFNSYLL
jgi:hypothetical protein